MALGDCGSDEDDEALGRLAASGGRGRRRSIAAEKHSSLSSIEVLEELSGGNSRPPLESGGKRTSKSVPSYKRDSRMRHGGHNGYAKSGLPQTNPRLKGLQQPEEAAADGLRRGRRVVTGLLLPVHCARPPQELVELIHSRDFLVKRMAELQESKLRLLELAKAVDLANGEGPVLQTHLNENIPTNKVAGNTSKGVASKALVDVWRGLVVVIGHPRGLLSSSLQGKLDQYIAMMENQFKD
ncbi:hypothetical protein THAOC_05722 [Thalassiosira oceanica]|uniref:Uncharacterized protein n=1 Tax=Thalassiosira oceanica TaxID=159749 RepID=K0TMJ1_THAOC|nr:hypothetical protein THAOC_05722 [Thalassiosira oceanica]|eukprot:EJK72717.1 hypothetical protein THAOC_05722 [Thalassiosira oceanica]